LSEHATDAPEHILCDTNVVGLLQASRKNADVIAHWPQDVRDRLDSAVLAMSVISVAELRGGQIYAGWGSDRRAAAERVMAAYLWVPLDLQIVDRCAEMRAEKQKRGWGAGDNDLWIAATASVRGWPLASTDLDFCDMTPLDFLYLPAKADSPSACP
jgi:predicted nucleic acid-binding protein